MVVTQQSTSQVLETWVQHLCDFICNGDDGQLYVSANEQLFAHGSNPTLETALHSVKASLAFGLEPVVLEGLSELGLKPRAGITARAIASAIGRAFFDYGAAAARRRHHRALRMDRLPITVTVGAILDAATESDPGRSSWPGHLSASMN